MRRPGGASTRPTPATRPRRSTTRAPLRALTQYAQAVAVLEDAAVKHPYSTPVLAAYGKALADAGRLHEAMDVLGRAHTPDKPDWSVLSAQGAVSDQLGDHAGALNYYDAALKIRPGEPSVMSNLGLSYALAKQLPQAEATLKTAAADPRADMRVRQNYALVLSLEGKFQLAEQVAATDLSAADAAESVSAIRQMIAEQRLLAQCPEGGCCAPGEEPERSHRRLDRASGLPRRAATSRARGRPAAPAQHSRPHGADRKHRLGLADHAGRRSRTISASAGERRPACGHASRRSIGPRPRPGRTRHRRVRDAAGARGRRRGRSTLRGYGSSRRCRSATRTSPACSPRPAYRIFDRGFAPKGHSGPWGCPRRSSRG